jgi:hypothetical protein
MNLYRRAGYRFRRGETPGIGDVTPPDLPTLFSEPG